MRTLNDVKKMAETLIAKEFTFNTYHGVFTMSAKSLGYRFEFDSAKRRFGACWYVAKKITLSMPLSKENLDKIETRITNTMLHELAHAFSVEVYGIREGKGHGYNWKHIAKQIGCDGERCYDGESVNKPQSKYTLVCDSCNRETPKHKVVRKSYACGKCCNEHNNGKFSDKFKLRLVTNY
jgi:predicted SprT family Zn-dependent metalloprotease